MATGGCEGGGAARIRGHTSDPAQPMCREIEAVRAAVSARLNVHETACAGSGRRCIHFAGCLKQRNRAEIAEADVVIAAHAALFTGFAVETSTIGVVLIDEGCWQRAKRTSHKLHVESFVSDLIGHSLRGRNLDDAIADLHDLRGRAVEALGTAGPVARSRLLRVGLDKTACLLGVQLEERRLRDPGLFPGISGAERKAAMERVRTNEQTWPFIDVWTAMQDIVAGSQENDGRLQVRSTAAGLHEIVVTGVQAVHPTLRDKSVLHLDATLRPELARSVLRTSRCARSTPPPRACRFASSAAASARGDCARAQASMLRRRGAAATGWTRSSTTFAGRRGGSLSGGCWS